MIERTVELLVKKKITYLKIRWSHRSTCRGSTMRSDCDTFLVDREGALSSELWFIAFAVRVHSFLGNTLLSSNHKSLNESEEWHKKVDTILVTSELLSDL